MRSDFKHTLKYVVLLIFLSSGKLVFAQDTTEPAVRKFNFDIVTAGGVIDDNVQGLISGTASLPVSHSYGFQFDGSMAAGEGEERGGVAGHFFYRDPASYMIGGTIMWGRVGDYDIMRIGPEAELYSGNTSFYFNGGWQDEDDRSTAFGVAKVSYYITDSFVVGALATGFSNVRGGGLDAEWQPGSMPFSIFAEVGDDNKSAGYALAGARVSFGTEGASLKDRHRKYDPPNIVHTFTAQNSSSAAPPPQNPLMTGRYH